MSRSQRLLDLIQILRRHRFPVTGAQLAADLNISIRTLYRDIGTLQAQGADIQGEPGLGYILRPGFMLPPLMFSEDEIQALVLGSRWVAKRTDEQLSTAAKNALAKIAAVLPEDLRVSLESSTLLVGPSDSALTGEAFLPQIRQAIRGERKLEIVYRSLKNEESHRIIWPFALGYFDLVHVLVAWCEKRQGFRHFRTDCIISLKEGNTRYPKRRQRLLKEWHEMEKITPQ
ncbi:transcriptional regulator [Rahnella sp. AA]|uniref:helix-turn-helix transcriptional regulator n=1 Tax=Rahnella sp. AA TaxID=2057180 RepID=UPI000C320F1C|nr:YafY family protein [Rahnella sp. AA]PKE29558.1 transcriptional regulator [Rahnella sp. AA]